ncbi:MAG: MBL fold metallo-hydrolase [Myxococcota bacterium]
MRTLLSTVGMLSVAAMLVFFAAAAYFLNTYEAPPVDPAWALPGSETVPPGAVHVRFTGTSTLLFSDGTTDWMVDGWFSRPGPLSLLFGEIEPDLAAIDAGLAANEVERLAVVIPVHSHFDHAMDAPEVAKRTGAILLGSESTANIGRGWGLDEARIRVAEDGAPHRFGAFTIRLIHTHHFEFPDPEMRARALADPRIDAPLVPPVGAFEYKVGQPYAIHVTHPKGRFLIQASAGYVEGSLGAYPAETVFLGVGGLGPQTEAYREAYWRETVERVGARRLFPIHWDSLMGPIEGPFTGELVAAGFLSSGTDETLSFLREKFAAHPELKVGTLPRYAPVVLFP